MTLTIENANAEFTKIVKEIAKLFPEIKLKKQKNVKCEAEKEAAKAKKECVGSVRRALKELENGEYEEYANFDEYKRAMSRYVES